MCLVYWEFGLGDILNPMGAVFAQILFKGDQNRMMLQYWSACLSQDDPFLFLKLSLHSLLTAASTLWTLRRQVRLCSMLCMPTESRKWWLLRKWKMLFKINISSGIWETHRFLSSSRIVAQVRSEKGNQTLGKSHSLFLPLLLARREVRALKQLPQPQSMVRSGMVGREHQGCSYSSCRCLAWGEAQQPQSSAPRQEQKHARLSQSLCSFIKVKLHVSDALFRFYILGC